MTEQAEREPSHWREVTNNGTEHVFHLVRGQNQLVGTLRCVYETSGSEPVLYIEDLTTQAEESRQNLGLARKVLKKIKDLADAKEIKTVRWVITESQQMRELSAILRDAGLAIEENPHRYRIPVQNLDPKTILMLLRQYPQSGRQALRKQRQRTRRSEV